MVHDHFDVWLDRQGRDAPLSVPGRLAALCITLRVRPEPRAETPLTHRDTYLEAVLGPLEALRLETQIHVAFKQRRGGCEDEVAQVARETLQSLPTVDEAHALFMSAWQSWHVYLATTVARRQASSHPPSPHPFEEPGCADHTGADVRRIVRSEIAKMQSDWQAVNAGRAPLPR